MALILSKVDYKKASDLDLWICCQKDDIKAYNELFHRYSSKLYHQASRYILDKQVAEELMLDLLFDLWEKRNKRSIAGELSAYLYRAMRNKIVDYRRQAVPMMTSIDETSLADTLEDGETGDYLVINSDAKSLYNNVLDKMSPQRRQVFQLSREANLTHSEIAAKMGISINTVENYMSTALKVFRQHTKEYIYSITLICSLVSSNYFPLFL